MEERKIQPKMNLIPKNASDNLESFGKDSIEAFLRNSGMEHVPKIETHIFFNQHSTAAEGKMVADRLEDRDILIQENAGWDEERLATWNKVAIGEFTADQALLYEQERGKPFFWPEYFRIILERLYKSEKEVLLIDVKSDTEIYQELIKFFGKESPYWNLVDKSKSFEEVCDYIADVSEFESILQTEREDVMLKSLDAQLLKVLKDHPDLQNKDSLKILLSMGSFHTRLYHEMKKTGNTVSREFQEMPYVFHPRMAAERSVHFQGVEKSKDYMSKVLLIWLLERSNMHFRDISNKVISRFSENQIRDLFEMYKQSTSDESFRDEAQRWITNQV